ncbi:hypothetical protein ANAPRD1_01295 [Anaplasma phagocytophilum]|nr:hypothetical protein ANAPH1_01011 [Anaplasma phagocytophilum]SCV66778.1 hypothetical protein ANAPRD1_01295 [Anaplasma phagocytophilum]
MLCKPLSQEITIVLRRPFRKFLPKDLILPLIKRGEHYCTMQLRPVMVISMAFWLKEDVLLISKMLMDLLQNKHVRRQGMHAHSGMEQM